MQTPISIRTIIASRLLAPGIVIALLDTSLAIADKPTGGTSVVYTVTELHVDSDGRASAVNNPDANGVLSIVGRTANVAGDKSAALWNATETGAVLALTILSPVRFSETGAVAVSDDGVVVLTRPGRVVVPGLGLTPILLPGAESLFSEANGVNNVGDVVGVIIDLEGNESGALWHIDGQGNIARPINLGSFYPEDINDIGVMVGQSAGVAATAAFDVDGILQVQSLGVLAAVDTSSIAYAINNVGEIAGTSTGAARKAFYWNSTGGMISVGNLGGKQSEAFSINDQGQVVGTTQLKNGSSTAFLWRNGKTSNLNALSGVSGSRSLIAANGINNSGHIVGEMRIELPVLNYQGFVLTRKP